MSNKQETVADIVADIRAQNQGLPEDSYALSPLVCDLLGLADRIEAAHKTEIKQIKFNFGQGDCVKCAEVPDESCKYYGEPDGCNFRSLANILRKAEVCEMIGREATREKSSQVGNAAAMRDALVAMVEAETGGTMERDYLCGRCLERLFDRCKHDGSCWVDKVMNALAESKGEAE